MIHSGRIFHFIEFLDFILLFDNFENSINFVVVKQQENVVFLTMHSVGVVNWKCPDNGFKILRTNVDTNIFMQLFVEVA